MFAMFQDDVLDLTENMPPHVAVAVRAETYLVVVEQQPVVSNTDFPSAVADFIGVVYAMNLQYPGKHTYEFIQSVFLNIDTKKMAAKVVSVCEKLAVKKGSRA